MHHRAFASDGFTQRNAAGFGKIAQYGFGQRIAHAAARNDQWPFGRFQRGDGFGQLLQIGARARDMVHRGFKKRLGVIKGNFLRVLTQPDKGGSAIGRIKHRSYCLRQR